MTDLIENYTNQLNEKKFTGASGLARFALEYVINIANHSINNVNDFVELIDKMANVTAKYKPSRAPIENALRFISARAHLWISAYKPEILQKKIGQAAQNYLDYMYQAQFSVSRYISHYLQNVQTIMTLCRSTTVIKGLDEIYKNNPSLKVIVLEARPDYDGWETAKELGNKGINTTLIVDSAACSLLRSVNVILVGADIVTSDGSVINRVGTSQLAILAQHFRIPFYIATASYTFRKMDSSEILLATRSPYRITPKEIQDNWKNVRVINQVDDMTKANMITGLFCDQGLIKPTEIAKFVSEFDAWISGINDTYPTCQQLLED